MAVVEAGTNSGAPNALAACGCSVSANSGAGVQVISGRRRNSVAARSATKSVWFEYSWRSRKSPVTVTGVGVVGVIGAARATSIWVRTMSVSIHKDFPKDGLGSIA